MASVYRKGECHLTGFVQVKFTSINFLALGGGGGLESTVLCVCIFKY